MSVLQAKQAVDVEQRQNAGSMLAGDIRALRKARGLTLNEIGLKLGRSVGWLSQVERGLSVPSLADLRAFAELFGIPVSFSSPMTRPTRANAA